MKKIYSKLDKKKLLHIVFRPTKRNQRINISTDNEFMQVCYLNLNKEKKVMCITLNSIPSPICNINNPRYIGFLE